MNFKKIFLSLLGLFYCSGGLFAQYNPKKLFELAESFQKTDLEQQKAAEKFAKKRNIPLLQIAKSGKIKVVQGFDDFGRLQYLTNFNNLDAAITVGTNTLWQGGSLGLSLSGNNPALSGRLGCWDIGGTPLLTHQEFGARVKSMDGNTSAVPHATHVAGTMIAAGMNPLAKGMAHTIAQLSYYDASNDLTEMAREAANGMLVSNHSYGTIAGWHFDESKKGTSTDPQWIWVGYKPISATEDIGFGFY